MKKSLLIVLLAALITPFSLNAQERDMWDYVNSFLTSTGRQHGIVSDGQFIYTSAWGKSSTVFSMIYKYDIDGNLLEEFDIPGVTNSDNYLRDMTFDGQYFYGCDNYTNNIWCYDLYAHTLVGSINTGMTTVENDQTVQKPLGICTYDPIHDAFWVGERCTGESPNLMLDLYLVDRNGNVIQTATPHALGSYSVHGTGYFTDENGQAHVYLHCVAGFTAKVFDYNITTDQLGTSPIFDMSNTPGWGVACTAGGAYIGEFGGSTYFFGDVDRSPNLIGIYALGEYTPVEPIAPEGDIFFDFNNGVLRWTKIDADGDGFNWELRQNFNNPENPCSVTSASYDDLNEVPLTPENYLITPYKLDCEEVTFIACAQDYLHPAEHFGLAISVDGNTDPDDFTIIWEADMTAKSPGNWHFYSVDLREYQGLEMYIAFVHFNCTDQFMLNIDDVTLYRTYNAVNENVMSNVSVYPNPTVDVVMIESQVVVNQYDIYNVAGEMICSKPVDAKSFEVNMSELPAGVYVITMKSEGMVTARRIVKR